MSNQYIKYAICFHKNSKTLAMDHYTHILIRVDIQYLLLDDKHFFYKRGRLNSIKKRGGKPYHFIGIIIKRKKEKKRKEMIYVEYKIS